MTTYCISCGQPAQGHYHFTVDDARPSCNLCVRTQAIVEFEDEYWTYEMFWDFAEYPPVNFFDGH